MIENNPEELATTLDRNLDHEVSLVIYGRAALCLGFENAPEVYGTTQDIDGIITQSQHLDLIEDLPFWDALERTNEELSPKGLYITHLFGEEQVFLRKDWADHIAPVERPPTKFLRLFRPATIDLVLTKMMRGDDDQDMQDVEFLIRRGKITVTDLETAFTNANLTDIPELHEAFERAKPVVLEIANQIGNVGDRS